MSKQAEFAVILKMNPMFSDLGSDELQKAGYVRKGREPVVGPMPPFGAIVKSSDDLFKIFAFVRSKYSENADPKYKFGAPPEEQ